MRKKASVIYYLPILAVGIIYFSLVLWVLPQESFYSPDNGIKFIQLKEMMKQDTINPSIPLIGKKIDEDLEFQPFSWLVKIKDNKIYSHYSPFYPWLTSFFYKKFGVAGLYVISALAGFLSLIIMYHLSRYFFDEGVSLLSSILLGLGTPIFFYSLVYWEHALGFFLGILILLIIIKIIEGKIGFVILLPPLSILGIFSRSETAVFIIALIISGIILSWKELKKNRRAIWICGFASLIMFGSFIAINLATSGTLFGIHISRHLLNYHTISSILTPSMRRAKIIVTLLGRSGLPPMIIDYVNTSLVMLSFIFSSAAVILLRRQNKLFNEKRAGIVLFLGAAVVFIVSVINLFSGSHLIGLLQVTPFAIFVLFSFMENESSILLNFIKLSTVIYFALLLFMPTVGGMQWGPRYIIYIYPLLIILFWRALLVIKKNDGIMKSALMSLFIMVFLISFILQFQGIVQLYSMKNERLRVRAVVASEPTNVIISAFENYLAQYCSDMYDKKMFFTASNDNVGSLINDLYSNGITEFSVSPAKQLKTDSGIKTSTLLGLNGSDIKDGFRRLALIDEIYIDGKKKNEPTLRVFKIIE